MTNWTYENTRKGYARLWDSIAIKEGKDATNADFYADKIIKGEKQYRAVEAATGVPWYVVGAIHMRESGCDFKGVLHNGEKIIGTRKKTKLVPAGRGPFKTWADAAIDALSMKNVEQWRGKWCPALIGWFTETFNGIGYVGKGVNSPYAWAGSNHEQTGKYVADHVWDKSFDDPQIGTMTVLKAIANKRPDVVAALAENHVSPMSNTTKATIGGAAGAVVAGGGAAATDSSSTIDQLQPVIHIFQEYGTTIGIVFTAAVVIGCVAWYFYSKAKNAEAGA